MTTYLYSQIANGETIVFDPAVDTLVIDSADISAADFRFTALPDDGVRCAQGGKVFTLDVATLASLNQTNVQFADGSMLVNSAAVNGFANDLSGTVHDDLLLSVNAPAVNRVSETNAGAPSNQASISPAVSADGQYIVFASTSTDLGTGADTNGVSDIFLKNLETGALTRVSTTSGGKQAVGTDLGSFAPTLSADGRYLVFASDATNLVSGDTNGAIDIFRKDLMTGVVTRISTTSTGAQADFDSTQASISADGRYVAFTSHATNLQPGDTNNGPDVYVKDTLTGNLVLASSTPDGVRGNGGWSYSAPSPDLSADGRYVLFSSTSTNFAPNDINNLPDLFVKDLQTGALTCVSTDIHGNLLQYSAALGSLSADGRYVVFSSPVEVMYDGLDGPGSVYLRDLQTGELHRVVGSGGSISNNAPKVSGDGRFVVFTSTAALVTGDTNDVADVYIKDMQTGALERVSVGVHGEQSAGGSLRGDISDDGQTIVFTSLGSELVGGAAGVEQVFTVANPLIGPTLRGSLGDDVYHLDRPGVIVEHAREGTDTVRASISHTLADNVEHLVLTGGAAIDGRGNAQANRITGNNATNVIAGGVGNDTLDGAGGIDTVSYEDATAGVTVQLGISGAQNTVGDGTDTLANFENVRGSGFNDKLTGTAGNNLLDGGRGADRLTGDAGDDIYVVDDAGDLTLEYVGGGTDEVRASLSVTLQSSVENLTLLGSAAINGTGNGLANTIVGNSAANVLDGGRGADTLVGGTGEDTYIIDNAGDTVVELGELEHDQAYASLSWTLAEGVEDLTLTGSAAINATGNSGNNRIVGNDAANVLNSGGGNYDTLVGGGGNDTYVFGFGHVTTIEEAGGGTDTVMTESAWNLGAEFENLILTGNASVAGHGNAKDNHLTGNSGANYLDGGAGADTIVGGAGDDRYFVDNALDVVTEATNEGNDSVESSVGWTLGAHFETLRLSGNASVNATGNTLDNFLYGNAGANVLDGGSGADQMRGGNGDDTYIVDDAGDLVEEAGGAGTDLVVSSVNQALSTNVEHLTLTGSAVSGDGNSLANRITGNALANTLNGGGGADTLIGAAGNDTYVVDHASDQVHEQAGDGHDLVRSSVSIVLSAEVEDLTLTGSLAINGTGNQLSNTLLGNSGSNVLTGLAGDDSLNGGVGADRMIGGSGNDSYTLDDAGDQVVELAGEGRDRVQSSVSWTMSAEVEDLTLTGTAQNATGNNLGNLIVGNASNNRLDGGTGVDTMSGGAGDDTYLVDNASDQANELAGQGSDTVQSTVDWALPDNLENLTLAGSAVAGTGNALANVIAGNALNNTLYGGAGNDSLNGGSGADTLTGGGGNDTYYVDAAEDLAIETAGGGTDTVFASASVTLSSEVENLTLTGSAIAGTGNALANVIFGNGQNNTLNGGAGTDTLTGGAGNDTYYFDVATDQAIETAGGGMDTILAWASITLANEVENLVLSGTALNGTGNGLANQITGNSSNNRIDGGAGADTMAGGIGNDTYLVSELGDKVTELAGQGTDTVQSSVNWTLGAELENLTLVGGAVNGTGNGLANSIVGNGLGNTLDGGAGIDTLAGGGGNDVYYVDVATDHVVESAGGGTDTVFSGVAFTLAVEVENLFLSGVASSGTGNSQANQITGNAAANVIDGREGRDTLTGGAGSDTFVLGDLGNDLINDMASGGDQIKIDQARVRIGDGDNIVDGAVEVTGSQAFSATAELVVITDLITAGFTLQDAALFIGSASGSYATGQTRVFAVNDGHATYLLHFTSVDGDAVVEANELAWLATVGNEAHLDTSDIIFGV